MAPESIIQELIEHFSETCKPKVNDDLLESANEQTLDGFAMEPIKADNNRKGLA